MLKSLANLLCMCFTLQKMDMDEKKLLDERIRELEAENESLRERLNLKIETADMAMVKLAGPAVLKEIKELISATGRTGYKKVNENFTSVQFVDCLRLTLCTSIFMLS